MNKFWKKIPKAWRAHIVSFLHTFISTFAVFVIAQVQQGGLNFTKDALWAVGAGALRAALKVAFAKEVVAPTISTDNPDAGNTTMGGGL